MKKKRLVAYYSHLQMMYLGKDAVLIPTYLSEMMHLKGYFYYNSKLGDDPLPKGYRGSQLIRLSQNEPTFWQQLFQMIRHIVLPARSIDVVFLLNTTHQVLLTTILYKWVNPKGKVMVMGDYDDSWIDKIKQNGFLGKRTGIKRKLMSKFVNTFFRKCDAFSIANEAVLQACIPLFHKNNWNNLVHCYPGIDDKLFNELNLKERPWDEKENIILYVGRIGAHQKNTDMILDAAAQTDLKDWKIILIGPITDDFSTTSSSKYTQKIEAFYRQNPQLKDKIIFTGAIYDPKIIFDYYNRAKILLMTSRHEGFSNVLSQAAALGCYILSTEVGGASIASNNWEFGHKLKQEDSIYLSQILTQIVNGELHYDFTQRLTFDKLSWSNMLKEKVLPKLSKHTK
mgnify:CR=1 FL=1